MTPDEKAIERIQYAEGFSFHKYNKPPVVAYSGGKDSDVLLALVERSGIQFTVQHNHTTADAPETVYHVRDVFRRLELKGIQATYNRPTYKGQPTSMWKLIPQRLMPPTRLMRYCCDVLKESGGRDSLLLTGVRWHESWRRSQNRGILENNQRRSKGSIVYMDDNLENRRQFEECRLKTRTNINPIVDWYDTDVWDYVNSEKVLMNPLYTLHGFSRVGCIGCPMANKKRWTEFRLYPKYEQAYRNAFGRMLEERKRRGAHTLQWKTADDVFRWWMEDKNLDGQMEFGDYTTEKSVIYSDIVQ